MTERTGVMGRWVAVLAALVAVLVVSPSHAVARDDALQREAQRRGLLFVEAVNAGDDAHRRELIPQLMAEDVLARISLDRFAAMFTRLHDTYAPMTKPTIEVAVFGTGSSARAVLHVFAKDRTGEWRDFQIRQQTQAPHALTEIAFVATVTEPIALPNGAITAPETIAWLRGYIGRLAQEHELSCSVLITGPEGVLLETQAGFMDAARTRRITADTRFGIASIGKTFTAVEVARLVREGRVSFDDPVSTYVPEVAAAYGQGFADRCLIRHLLSHTSGVPEYWTDQYEAAGARMHAVRDYLPWITRRAVEFAPGDRFAYSNSNYILLGLVIEKATGRDYFEVVREGVLDPAGMAGTAFRRDDRTATPLEGEVGNWRAIDRVAAEHGRGDDGDDQDGGAAAGDVGGGGADGEGAERARGGVLHCSSAGGALSTARDLERFIRAVHEGRLLGAELTARVLTPAPPEHADAGSNWSLGFELRTQGGVPSVGHGGTAPGAQAEMRLYPDEGIAVVILANQNQPAFDDLRRIVAKLVTGER